MSLSNVYTIVDLADGCLLWAGRDINEAREAAKNVWKTYRIEIWCGGSNIGTEIWSYKNKCWERTMY